MATALVLKVPKYFTPRHSYHKFLKPAKFSRAGIHDLDIPSYLSRVSPIHFKEVSNKQGGLISTRTSS
jgi:hypothetical protein